MTLPVKLSDVVAEMDVMDSEWNAYINRRTGGLLTMTPDDWRALEEPGEAEVPRPPTLEQLESDEYLALPDSFEIHEWSIMERFTAALEDRESRERLERVIHRRGAFRGFRDEVHALGIPEAWFRYRDNALEEIASTFLQENNIPFTRDSPG